MHAARRLSAFYFLYFCYVGAFTPYFSLFLAQRGLGPERIALLFSVLQIMRLAAPALWSTLADRGVSRLRVLRWASALAFLGYVGFLLPGPYAQLLVAMAVSAFFWSAVLPLTEALTFACLGGERSSYGRIRAWGSIGFIVAAQALGLALDHLPVLIVPWSCAAVIAAVWLAAGLLPQAPAVAVAPRVSLRAVLARPQVWGLLTAGFFMTAAHGAFYIFFSLHLVALGYSKALVGGLWILGVLAEIVVFWRLPWLLGRASVWRLIALCLVAAALRFLANGWLAQHLLAIVLAQLLHGASFGLHHAVSVAAVHRWFPPGTQARGQALFGSFSFGAGGLLGSLASGYAWARWGPEWTYSLGAGMALLGLLVWGAVRAAVYETERNRENIVAV